ncbi:MAG: hypothetical protein FJY20_05115 [Bacteroidetes bacterium]|nr:hypothetical protein [Bacteroidota bacterium]
MKRILLPFLLFTGLFAGAQPYNYNNEWIDYSKTYYKFKLPAAISPNLNGMAPISMAKSWQTVFICTGWLPT